jgi:hypothetical protein
MATASVKDRVGKMSTAFDSTKHGESLGLSITLSHVINARICLLRLLLLTSGLAHYVDVHET